MGKRGAFATGKKYARIVRGQSRQYGRKVLASTFGGLQTIADQLNDVPHLEAQSIDEECRRPHFKGWNLAKAIVSLPLDQAIEVFTAQAKDHPVNMYVEYRAKRLRADKSVWPTPLVESRDEIGTVLWHLWLYYFRDYGWKRLKSCPVCKRWFVDTSKNRATARCSESCTWRWWNRERRKEAHSPKKGAKHGTEAR
jgi:hypothetical protein